MMTNGELELVIANEDEKLMLRKLEEVLNDENAFPETSRHSLLKIIGTS